MTQTKAIATIEKTASDFLTNLKSTLPAYAVREYKQETFVRSAMVAIISSPDLQECFKSDEGKASLINAMRMAAGTGLSLNPQEGKAALIAYSKNIGTQQNKKWAKTASYQVMKNGLIELALESKKVEFITADTVRENDEFTLAKTMNGDEYYFSPARIDRGKIDGFFAAVKMKDGSCHTVYMAQQQTKEHREHFSKKTAMPDEGYGRKTVLKQLLNNLYISPEVSQAIGADNFEEAQLIDAPLLDGVGADDLHGKLTEKVDVKAEEAGKVDVETGEIKKKQGAAEKKENDESVI